MTWSRNARTVSTTVGCITSSRAAGQRAISWSGASGVATVVLVAPARRRLDVRHRLGLAADRGSPGRRCRRRSRSRTCGGGRQISDDRCVRGERRQGHVPDRRRRLVVVDGRSGTVEPMTRMVIHADDVGMCHGANQAFVELARFGTIGAGSVMVPCPWFPEIAAIAAGDRHARRRGAPHARTPNSRATAGRRSRGPSSGRRADRRTRVLLVDGRRGPRQRPPRRRRGRVAGADRPSDRCRHRRVPPRRPHGISAGARVVRPLHRARRRVRRAGPDHRDAATSTARTITSPTSPKQQFAPFVAQARSAGMPIVRSGPRDRLRSPAWCSARLPGRC